MLTFVTLVGVSWIFLLVAPIKRGEEPMRTIITLIGLIWVLILLAFIDGCSPAPVSPAAEPGKTACDVTHTVDKLKSHVRWMSHKNAEKIPVIGTQTLSGSSSNVRDLNLYIEETETFNDLRDSRIDDILFQKFVSLDIRSKADLPAVGNTKLETFNANLVIGDRLTAVEVPGYITSFENGFNITNGDKKILLNAETLKLSDRMKELAEAADVTIENEVDVHYDIYFKKTECQ